MEDTSLRCLKVNIKSLINWINIGSDSSHSVLQDLEWNTLAEFMNLLSFILIKHLKFLRNQFCLCISWPESLNGLIVEEFQEIFFVQMVAFDSFVFFWRFITVDKLIKIKVKVLKIEVSFHFFNVLRVN